MTSHGPQDKTSNVKMSHTINIFGETNIETSWANIKHTHYLWIKYLLMLHFLVFCEFQTNSME
jgi:hypothetical protein